MKLSNAYFKEFTLREVCADIEKDYPITEVVSPQLVSLLNRADELIFDKFNIKKEEKKYFISGSARLYLSKEISELFNLTKPVGDLDVVIPNKELWINAGLEKEYNEGVFKPTKDGSMEVFNVWDPSRSGDDLYATTSVRNSSEIMDDLTFHEGYWYMSLYDVIDYKLGLDRRKEAGVVSLVKQYSKAMRNGDTDKKSEFLKRMVLGLGKTETKKFFSRIGSEIESGNRRISTDVKQ
tara:strand:+ start:1275 stop:1985 length:711 start_codon:yes stop_codon:yes gene_type:complete